MGSKWVWVRVQPKLPMGYPHHSLIMIDVVVKGQTFLHLLISFTCVIVDGFILVIYLQPE
jgi:hypothetical protein